MAKACCNILMRAGSSYVSPYGMGYVQGDAHSMRQAGRTHMPEGGLELVSEPDGR